jgi:gluconolactonase
MKHCTVTKLLDLPFYTEGPAIDTVGNYFFSALTGGFIGKIDQTGKFSKWATGTCPNGQVTLANGEHWLCDSLEPGIARYDASGTSKGFHVVGSCAGNQVTAANDLIIDSAGNLYFTDSIREDGKVFFKAIDGKELVVASGLDYPNGLVLSQDEKCLFVAESYGNRILVIELTEPGIAGKSPGVFSELPCHPSGNVIDNLPDGMAIDLQGRLWIAHYGMQAIQVLAPDGDFLFSVDTTLPLTSNLCFQQDTPSKKILLVTGGYGEPGPGAVLLVTVDF